MVVGGPCSIEGCNRTRMYNSPVCYKHKDDAEDIWWAEEDNSVERGTKSNSSIVGWFLWETYFEGLFWNIILGVVLFLLLVISDAL